MAGLNEDYLRMFRGTAIRRGLLNPDLRSEVADLLEQEIGNLDRLDQLKNGKELKIFK